MPQAQFTSPRFIGDNVLEDILSDPNPDAGTKKLDSSSPKPSVERVQQALFDLGWNLRANPAVEDHDTFVDGVYGPATTRAVLNYKIYFDIHFPTSARFGLYDGFAGPGTLGHLDSHIALFDEAVDAINAKVPDLQAAGVSVQMPVSDAFPERFLIVPAAMGVSHLATIDGAPGAIFFKRGVGAFEVHGAIVQAYHDQGFANGKFGFPNSDEHDDGAGVRRSDFENGSIRFEVSTAQVSFIGPAATAPDVLLF